MKISNQFFVLVILLFSTTNFQAQIKNVAIENALSIAEINKVKLENVNQLLVVYNQKPDSFTAFFVALERKGTNWIVKQKPIEARIGKNGFALPHQKVEGDGKSPTGIFKIGKLFSYEKQNYTLLENQQTTKDDKWIDDVNSPDYNKYISGSTEAKSFENLLQSSDIYKYCMVIEYNTNPIVKGKGSAIFFHLAIKSHPFTLGCVAIQEEYMKMMIDWLNPSQNPTIIMGNLAVLKSGL